MWCRNRAVSKRETPIVADEQHKRCRHLHLHESPRGCGPVGFVFGVGHWWTSAANKGRYCRSRSVAARRSALERGQAVRFTSLKVGPPERLKIS